jgi:hypothetical protein
MKTDSQGPKLLISQQGSPLAVLANDLSSREGVASQESRHTDGEREDEQEAADGESEDPL